MILRGSQELAPHNVEQVEKSVEDVQIEASRRDCAFRGVVRISVGVGLI
ncbi:hypothetical protein J6500_03405 [Bradyrhizobium sp. WSM 1704]|nr:hypothetical protein [Bradyrhizobium semiaridum]MCA6120952.1 hypothetical protein [Bradyrhizobium semiaridum]